MSTSGVECRSCVASLPYVLGRWTLAISVWAVLLAGGCSATDANPAQIDTVEPALGEIRPEVAPVTVSTTAPYVEQALPTPTPIDLGSGAGIVVAPTTPPEPTLEVDDPELSEPTAEPPTSSGTAATTLPTPPTTEATTTTGPATGVVPAASAEAIPTAASAASDQVIEVANGAEGYSVNCARCHSENGLGTFRAHGLIGIGGRYSRQTLIDELTSGHAYTFGFVDELSASEIAAIAAFALATF